MSERLTEELLANMTPAEREGYDLMLAEEAEQDDNADIDIDDDAELAATGDDDAGADDDGDDGQEDDVTLADEGTIDDGAAAAHAATDAAIEADPVDDIQYPYEAHTTVKELQAKIDANQEQQNALLEQFDDGELTREEYQEQLKELNAESRQHVKEQAKAETAIEEADNRYFQDVSSFLTENPMYKKGGLLFNALDEKVKELQAQSNNPRSPSIIRAAHKQIQEELGLKTDTPPAPKDGDPKPKPANVAKPKREIPPNLNSVPSSDVNDAADDNGRFAVLARMAKSDPIAHEQALAKMGEAEMDDYLRYGG